MKFLVYSRQLIESIEPHAEPHLIISIQTPGDPKEAKLPVNGLTRGVLRLRFDDLDRMPNIDVPRLLLVPGIPEEVARNMKVTLFDEEMAKQVLEFVEPHTARSSGTQAILVHCDAGWSRSPGVAAALEKGLFLQDDSHWFKQKTPNMLVYRTLMNAIFGTDQKSTEDDLSS